jgi:hypothetical protein
MPLNHNQTLPSAILISDCACLPQAGISEFNQRTPDSTTHHAGRMAPHVPHVVRGSPEPIVVQGELNATSFLNSLFDRLNKITWLCSR